MLFPVLVSVIHSYSKGYHTFVVKPNRPFCVTLQHSMLVFALDEVPPSRVNFTVIDPKNRTLPVPMQTFTHILFFDTTIFVSVPKGESFPLHYWLIPTDLCSAISYSAIADHQLTLKLHSPSLPSDFCIFSQSGAASYSATLDYHSDSTKGKIEFWTNSISPARRCRRNSLCQFTSRRPFFMRVINATDAEFEARVHFTALRRSIQSYECGIRPLPIVIRPPIQMPMGVIEISDIACVSMAEDVLSWVVTGIAVVTLISVLLCILHCSGVIDLKFLVRKDRFKELGENPYAAPILQDAE
jgi:hypothetical protein